MTTEADTGFAKAVSIIRDGLEAGYLRAGSSATRSSLEVVDHRRLNAALAEAGVAPGLLDRLFESNSGGDLPVETARQEVRQELARLEGCFAGLGRRLAASVGLYHSLRNLEQEAARRGWEGLSMAAAILRDTLRYQPVEAFSRPQWDAVRSAAETMLSAAPEEVDPEQCEARLLAVGLDWLPPLSMTPDALVREPAA